MGIVGRASLFLVVDMAMRVEMNAVVPDTGGRECERRIKNGKAVKEKRNSLGEDF